MPRLKAPIYILLQRAEGKSKRSAQQHKRNRAIQQRIDRIAVESKR